MIFKRNINMNHIIKMIGKQKKEFAGRPPWGSNPRPQG